jgi:hypothetical protein
MKREVAQITGNMIHPFLAAEIAAAAADTATQIGIRFAVSMPKSMREFHCEHVTVSGAGDYFQVLFAQTSDSDKGYVLVQGQCDGGVSYVETDDVDFCGHFRIPTAQLSRNRFRMAFGNNPVKQITVSFNANDSTYAEAKRVLQIIIPDLELR